MHQFVRGLIQLQYHYLTSKEYSYAQIFDDREYSFYENAASESEAGIKEFVRYIFNKLGGKEELDKKGRDVVQHLKDYIEQHLGDDLCRTVLAQEVYLSVGYISKLFLKETGISLTSYITERRIEKAKDYLVYSTLSVSRIAVEVGFNNFFYFSKSFRDVTGCTPNEYRMQQQKSNNKKRD